MNESESKVGDIRYATLITYYPTEGRRITLPEGAVAVCFVFEDKELARRFNDGDEPIELRRTSVGLVGMRVDRDTGEVSEVEGLG